MNMNKKRLSVGIIGAGGIAQSVHLPSLKDIKECELAWVCDLVETRAQKAAEEWNIPKYGTSYAKLLETNRPDAVFVLVQPDYIFRVALDCIQAGCHVFMEKPMGITRFQAETLVREGKMHNVQCQVGFNRRFIPLVQKVLARMEELGPLHQVDGWFYKNGDAAFYQGCGSAFDCDAIHTIDLVRYIAGSKARSTMQLAARYGDSPVDNAWNAIIAFENGVTGTVHSNYATGGRVHGFALHSSKASAYINIGFGGAACSAQILHHVTGTFSLASGGAGEQLIERLDGCEIAGSDEYHRYYGYQLQAQLFVKALLRGQAVPLNAQDALETMNLVHQMKASEISF